MLFCAGCDLQMMMKKASQINELKKKQATMGTGEMNWADMDAKFTSVGLAQS